MKSNPERFKAAFKELNKLFLSLKELQPKCPICLNNIQMRCYADVCLHSYCLSCLLEWWKVSRKCPICGQEFNAGYYNVKSIRTYHRIDLVPSGKETANCLLSSMSNIKSYIEIKQNFNQILCKYKISFEHFHRHVIYLRIK